MKLSPIKKVHRQVHKKKLGQGSDPMSRLAGTRGLTPVPKICLIYVMLAHLAVAVDRSRKRSL